MRGCILALLLCLCGLALAPGAAPAFGQRPPAPAGLTHRSGAALRVTDALRSGAAPLAPASPRQVEVAADGGFGGDGLVNAPGSDSGESTTQSETSLAADGATVCAGFNDSGEIGFSGFSRSTDGGVSFVDQGGLTANEFGDPVIAVHHASGAFYYADLAVIGGISAIGVSKSTDGCDSFATPVSASPTGSGAAYVQDKAWIAVDNSGGARDGYVYVCWTRFDYGETFSELRVSRSGDGGATFTNDQVISLGDEVFPFGCSIAVDGGGAVFVSYTSYSGDVYVRRSLDGAATWQPRVAVNATPQRLIGIDRIISCGPETRLSVNGDVRMAPQTWMAIDTSGGAHDGNVYIAWHVDPEGLVDNGDVVYARSLDGGATWSPPKRAGGGTLTDQFDPNLAVSDNGALAIAWYDRRNDTANNLALDVYAAISLDGGLHLGPLVRLTDASFGVPPINNQPTLSGNFDPRVKPCYMGEYMGAAAEGGTFHFAWGDNRTTVTTAAYPGGRLDPDVRTDTLADACAGDADCDGIGDAPDNCPGTWNALQLNSDAAYGNGSGIAGNDATVPGAAADVEADGCETDGDADNDGLADAADEDPGDDITYDDDGDGNPAAACLGGTDGDGSDDGPSWDTDCDGVLDGVSAATCAALSSSADGDGDRVPQRSEVCKWGTADGDTDSDNDGLTDCLEIIDVNGDGAKTFLSDLVPYAKAVQLPAASFGKDGDFDYNGSNSLNFLQDLLPVAKLIQLAPASGGCSTVP